MVFPSFNKTPDWKVKLPPVMFKIVLSVPVPFRRRIGAVTWFEFIIRSPVLTVIVPRLRVPPLRLMLMFVGTAFTSVKRARSVFVSEAIAPGDELGAESAFQLLGASQLPSSFFQVPLPPDAAGTIAIAVNKVIPRKQQAENGFLKAARLPAGGIFPSKWSAGTVDCSLCMLSWVDGRAFSSVFIPGWFGAESFKIEVVGYCGCEK